MKELQQLINKWKQEADNLENHNEREYDQCLFFQNNGSVLRLRKCINEAELLLKHDESKQPQPPDFANTMLGEVPHGENDQQEENSKAVEGATPVVRQNEQTKEVKKAIPFGIAMLRAKQHYRNTEDDNIPF